MTILCELHFYFSDWLGTKAGTTTKRLHNAQRCTQYRYMYVFYTYRKDHPQNWQYREESQPTKDVDRPSSEAN